jgi:release factor glutamine methyltransferase
MTYQDLLGWGKQCLEEASIEDSALDAWYLLEYVSDMSRSQYFLKTRDTVDEKQQEEYEALIRRRQQRIPLQHLTNQAFFMGFEFYVNEQVLVPRQDTECLVEEVLKIARPGMKILDMCTGSGCVLISLLKMQKGLTGTGAELSETALFVAHKNAEALEVDAKFVHSNLFEQISETYDIIVSNPPYIPTGVIRGLQPEVRDHEPFMALDGREDGLYFYEQIIAQGSKHLNPNGWMCFEIGYDQGEAVSRIFREHGYIKIQVLKDLAGLDRVVTAQIPDAWK